MDLSKILMKPQGVNIIRFHSISVSLGSIFFLLFQSIDVRASENLFDSQVFQLDLFNRGSKAKIVSPIFFFQNVFSCVFFCLSPLRPECSGIRKTASFLASHRRKKYKNLHPRSFTNGAKVWKMLKIANF